MIKGWILEYDISYKAELTPSQESSNCIEVRKSIWNPNNLQTPYELFVKNEKGEFVVANPHFGPAFCLVCRRNHSMIINGLHFPRNNCVEDNDPNLNCTYEACFYCRVII
ncbi:unnamed protein product [Meloidogyne enterolobii]|uniref:Uncharacterized protein n=1 Tax=Meloidogyne enterolobii TaxID=390850 RepID=A0ACB0YP38_MELEN